jgi:hypothetical protein
MASAIADASPRVEIIKRSRTEVAVNVLPRRWGAPIWSADAAVDSRQHRPDRETVVPFSMALIFLRNEA